MSFILFSLTNNVATLTLNRPEKFNAFNRQMALDLQSALENCDKEDEVRAVYITGVGKAFCAGQDLEEVVDPNGPGLAKIISEHYNPIINKIRNCKKPIVAAVNGVAAGAGANIALACDIVVATESASFIQAFSKIGLIPDSGGTFILPRLIGMQKATALMMLGEKISATNAESMAMIYKVFTDDQFAEESLKIATTLASMPTKGLAYTKQALNLSFAQTLDEQLKTEDNLQQAAGNTQDFKEGVNAFLEKRQPVFTGK